MTDLMRGGVRFEHLEDRQLLAGEPWGDFPQLIDLDDAVSRYPNVTGKGQTVVVIDSGIRYTHPALGGGFGPGDKVIAGYDFIDNDNDPIDPDGHGTGVASVIAADEYVFDGERYRGLAPDAKLIALRVAGDRTIERALQWVISHRAQYNIVAVNMSLGDGNHSGPVSLEPFGDELSTLHASGVFMSAVAGNGGVRGGINYPAAHPGVYAVGAIDDDDVIAEFSQRSDDLDLLAPGENLPLPYWDKTRSRHVYVPATGTSFAAPHAAAMAALLKQIDPSLSPDRIMQILRLSGEDNRDGDDESGTTTGLTYKRLNVENAIALAYAGLDDDLEEDDSTSGATTVSVGEGTTSFGNLRLIPHDDDYFVFDLARRSQVVLNVSASGLDDIELLNSSGNRINDLNSGTSTLSLSAGRYFLRFTGQDTGVASYGFGISARVVGPPEVHASFSSVATDAGGTAHLAYYDTDRENLWYATRAPSGDWSDPTLIDSAPGVGQYVSLAIDRKGRPAVAYHDSRNDDLKYALLHGGSWDFHKVDAAGNVGQYASLAFDARNHAAVAYYSDDRNELRLAELIKGAWSVRTIDTDGNAGKYSSIAVHPETGHLAIAYGNSTYDSVRYAEMVNSKKWRVTTVDKTEKGASHISLGFDRLGRTNISYYDAAGADLKFARRSAGGRWGLTTIASKGAVGKFSRVVFQPAGIPHVMYYNASDNSLYQASLTPKGWRTNQIATGGGTYVAAATLFGQKLILFRDGASGELREVVV